MVSKKYLLHKFWFKESGMLLWIITQPPSKKILKKFWKNSEKILKKFWKNSEKNSKKILQKFGNNSEKVWIFFLNQFQESLKKVLKQKCKIIYLFIFFIYLFFYLFYFFFSSKSYLNFETIFFNLSNFNSAFSIGPAANESSFSSVSG